MRTSQCMLRLFLEWDIVLYCLNLGFLFTQMLPQAPMKEFQKPHQDNADTFHQ
jgi:hypothetical protein